MRPPYAQPSARGGGRPEEPPTRAAAPPAQLGLRPARPSSAASRPSPPPPSGPAAPARPPPSAAPPREGLWLPSPPAEAAAWAPALPRLRHSPALPHPTQQPQPRRRRRASEGGGRRRWERPPARPIRSRPGLAARGARRETESGRPRTRLCVAAPRGGKDYSSRQAAGAARRSAAIL